MFSVDLNTTNRYLYDIVLNLGLSDTTYKIILGCNISLNVIFSFLTYFLKCNISLHFSHSILC